MLDDLPRLVYRCAQIVLAVAALSLVGAVVLKIMKPTAAVGTEWR